LKKPEEIFKAVHAGRDPKLLMDIHSVSEVNRPGIALSELPGPATSDTFNVDKKS
jgi:NADH-quinone oxidoreductase subunit G